MGPKANADYRNSNKSIKEAAAQPQPIPPPKKGYILNQAKMACILSTAGTKQQQQVVLIGAT